MKRRATIGGRTIAAALVAAVAACVLAGCSGGPAPEAGEVTLVFKHAKLPGDLALTEMVRQFEVEHPGVRIREELLPASSDEQHQFYVMNLAGGSDDFDVLDMDVIWVPEFARAGWLAELGPSVTEDELEPLFPGALQADWLNGQLYGVPWFVDAGVLYYRQDLLEKYGFAAPPRTYPELAAMAQRILEGENDPRLVGFVWQGKQYEGLICTALEFIRGNGGEVLGADGTPQLTEPDVSEALEFQRGLITASVTPATATTFDEEAARHMFQSGRAIFMRNWPYAWRLLNQPGSPVAGQVGLTLVPAFDDHASAPTLGGFHVGVNAFSRHKEEAIAFVRFMIRYEVQRQVLLGLGLLPAHRGVYDDAEVREARPEITELQQTLEHVQPRPVTPYYLMISQVLQPELSAVVAGLKSPEEAMRQASDQIEHLMGVR